MGSPRKSRNGTKKNQQIPKMTRIEDHHESTKNTNMCAVVQGSCIATWHANRVWNHTGLRPTRGNSVLSGCHCATGLGNLTELNRHELLATC